AFSKIIAESIQIHTYDGNPKQVQATLNHSKTDLQYMPRRNYTESGTYKVTVVAGETENYLGATEEIMLVINSAPITSITLPNGSFVYNGIARSLLVVGDLPVGASVTYENNNRTDVGRQKVTATISGDDYEDLVLTAFLTITPATRSISFPPLAEHTYGDEDFTVGALASSLEELMYASSNPGVATITSDGKIRIVGA